MKQEVQGLPEFDLPDLAAAVERLPANMLDALPFGAIRVDADGVVRDYSNAERRLSGYSKEAVGLDFYTQIAPCMNNAGFRGRIDAAAKAGTLDIEFGHVGDFSDRERDLRVRVMSASAGGYWIFMARED